MAVGDIQDFFQRLANAVPTGWFPSGMADATGRVYRVAGQAMGTATVYAQSWVQLQFFRAQTRISTATGGFLDLISRDYFGYKLPRKSAESDPNFRGRILANFFRPQGTRQAMIDALEALTGNVPVIVEPRRTADTGGYSLPPLAYSTAGAYGSMELPYQAFISIQRPYGGGIPNVAGYGNGFLTGVVVDSFSADFSDDFGGGIGVLPTGQPGLAGYGLGAIEYASLSMISGGVTDQDIYDTVLATKEEGTLVWVSLNDGTGITWDNWDPETEPIYV